MIMLHAGTQARTFRVPPPAHAIVWRKFIDTAAESPRDIFPEGNGPLLRRERVKLQPRSLMCFVAER